MSSPETMSDCSRMRDTVLVTGASGFVASRLIPLLEAKGFEVWPHGRAHGDLSLAAPSLGRATYVVHLAGRTFVPESWDHPSRFYRDNTFATANVLEYCRGVGARLVHLSSYAYGIPERLPIPETHPLHAVNPYAHSKILAEDLVRFYRDHYHVAATILRPFNLYGPGQDERFIIPSIVRQAIDPALAQIDVCDLGPRRDYLYVTDLVSLILAALRKEPGGIYNAGSGASVSVGQLTDLVRELARTNKPVRSTGEVRTNEVPDVVADITRAAADLNWRPLVGLREGLRDTIAWARRQAASR